jgi:hypothetical protein
VKFSPFSFASGYRKVALLTMVSALLVAHPLSAQTDVIHFDSDHSVAELFIGSVADPYSFSPGDARVTGDMVLDLEQPGRTLLDIHIFPANVAEDGRPDFANQIEFVSKRTVRIADGSLAIQGDLALTRVERSVSTDPGEAFSGPVYGEPEVRVIHHAVTFIFAAPELAQAKHTSTISAEAQIARQDFPEVLSTITSIDWPAVVQDEQCSPGASGAGESYAGQRCSGKVLAPANRIETVGAPGEDFSGARVLPPTGDQVTIRLNLRPLQRKQAAATVNGE